VQIMIERGFNSPLSGGAGRLFDAIGFLVAGRARVTFEAQAAMEVEALAAGFKGNARPYLLEDRKTLGDAPDRLDPAPAVRAIVDDLADGRPAGEVAAGFQQGLAESCAELAARLAGEKGVRDVLLSGGCFQNALLLGQLGRALEDRGLRWYANREVPANDAGVALGQVLAAVRAEEA